MKKYLLVILLVTISSLSIAANGDGSSGVAATSYGSLGATANGDGSSGIMANANGDGSSGIMANGGGSSGVASVRQLGNGFVQMCIKRQNMMASCVVSSLR